VNAALGRVSHHRTEIAVNQRFPANEEQIADVISHRDVDRVVGLLQSYAAPLFRIKLVHGKTAEVAFRVADIGDGELKITRPAVLQDFLEELPRPFRGPHCRRGESLARYHARGSRGLSNCIHQTVGGLCESAVGGAILCSIRL